MIHPLLIFQGSNIVIAKVVEEAERERIFNKARDHADRLGVPLVNYGCGTREPFISLSDINIDIVPRDTPNFIQIPSDGEIPLPRNSAVVFASHVLEHVNDPEKILRNMRQVGPTYIVLPRWYSITNWIYVNHKHIFTANGSIENPARFSIPLLVGINLLVLI